ncbi:MAG: hypothetical protein MRZ79_16210 [Bacteroidia bacterium]|nr:hypothetical protein [Bacteroidia bacterium]
MPSTFAEKYWKELRRNWSDALINKTVQMLHEKEYVIQIGELAGSNVESLKKRIDELEGNSTEGLGWLILDQIWQQIFDQVQGVSDDLSFDIPQMPILGSLPTGRINALALSVPGQEQFILAFELGLVNFATYISHFAAMHLEFGEKNQGQNIFKPKEMVEPAYRSKMIHVMLSYYSDGIPLLAQKDIFVTEDLRPLSSGFRNMMELFVLGHEYAHIGLGHLEKGKARAFAPNDGLDYPFILSEDFKDEYEADHAAYLIVLVHYLKRGLPYYFTAAVIRYFLQFCSILYKGLSILLAREINDDSHPPIADRIKYLESVLSQLISTEDMKSYLALSAFYQMLCDNFAEHLELVLTEEKENFTLAPIWNALKNENQSIR